jgi:hypothetical protein
MAARDPAGSGLGGVLDRVVAEPRAKLDRSVVGPAPADMVEL